MTHATVQETDLALLGMKAVEVGFFNVTRAPSDTSGCMKLPVKAKMLIPGLLGNNAHQFPMSEE